MKPRRVAVTGATGFIGRALVAALGADGVDVVTAGREPLDARALDGVDGVVHLAGEPIGRRWTAARKHAIRESRVEGTRRLAGLLATLEPRPRVLVAGSAMGVYGNRGDEWLTEESAPGTGFLADVVRAWEAAADPARRAGIRVVHSRTGLVLGAGGGVLAEMLPPFRAGVGGRLGSGRQWMSWIALQDLVDVLRRALVDDALDGAVNAASPAPVTNAEFTATLARVLRRPAVIPVPALVLRTLFGEMADETLLVSQRLRPARLERAQFSFAAPTLESALRRALGR